MIYTSEPFQVDKSMISMECLLISPICASYGELIAPATIRLNGFEFRAECDHSDFMWTPYTVN